MEFPIFQIIFELYFISSSSSSKFSSSNDCFFFFVALYASIRKINGGVMPVMPVKDSIIKDKGLSMSFSPYIFPIIKFIIY